MSAPSDKQLNYIDSLFKQVMSMVEERRSALETQKPTWLVFPENILPTTVKEASSLIESLKALTMLLRTVPCDAGSVSEDRTRLIVEVKTLLTQMTARDAGFACSLISQYDSRGSLSDKQWGCLSDLVGRMTKPQADTPSISDIEPGVYDLDGRTIRVTTTKAGYRVAHEMVDTGSSKSFQYRKGLIFDMGGAKPLPQDRARSFGREMKRCIACSRRLTDIRSEAGGYGPDCADKYGWHYPTLAEAEEMLGISKSTVNA